MGIGDDDVFDLGGIVGAIILVPLFGFVMKRTATAQRPSQ